jgi:hypothetical protein
MQTAAAWHSTHKAKDIHNGRFLANQAEISRSCLLRRYSLRKRTSLYSGVVEILSAAV